MSSGSSSQVVSAQEDQAEAAIRTLVRFARASQPQSLQLDPWPRKKKKGDRTRARQTKVAGVGLEDFVDWMGIIANEPVEEEEMSKLVTGFSARMCKWVASSKGETTPISDGKRPKLSSLDEGAQKDWVIISMDSLD